MGSPTREFLIGQITDLTNPNIVALAEKWDVVTANGDLNGDKMKGT